MKDIDFRSTFLVSIDLSPLQVPNAHFIDAAVVNVSRQASFRHQFVMPLSISVGMKRVRLFMNDLRRRLETHHKAGQGILLCFHSMMDGGKRMRVLVGPNSATMSDACLCTHTHPLRLLGPANCAPHPVSVRWQLFVWVFFFSHVHRAPRRSHGER